MSKTQLQALKKKELVTAGIEPVTFKGQLGLHFPGPSSKFGDDSWVVQEEDEGNDTSGAAADDQHDPGDRPAKAGVLVFRDLLDQHLEQNETNASEKSAHSLAQVGTPYVPKLVQLRRLKYLQNKTYNLFYSPMPQGRD